MFPSAALLLAVVAWSTPVLAKVDDVSASAPPAWSDLAAGGSPPAGSSEAMLQEARTGNFIVYAVSPDGSAIIQVRAMSGSMATSKLVDAIRAQAAKKVTILDVRLEQRFGLEVGRMEAVAGNEQRLVYFLPAGDGHVAAALVTSPANFQRWVPTLDAALHRIEGLEPVEDRWSQVTIGLLLSAAVQSAHGSGTGDAELPDFSSHCMNAVSRLTSRCC